MLFKKDHVHMRLWTRLYGRPGGGGGGGGTRLSTGRGVPLGGWKPDPVLNRSAHEKYTLS